jgi:hypothetical protein
MRLRLIAYSSALHVAPRINRRVVHANFIVHVWASRTAADARVADDLAALDTRPRHRRERREMSVPGGDAEAVVNHNQATVARMVFRDSHNPIRRCVYRRTIIGGHINARVERAFTAEWIQPFSEAVRDVSQYGPNRWRVRGVGEAHRRHQAQATGGNGNDRRVPFQERVLFDGAVEGIFRSNFAVGAIERRRVISEHAVSHSYFGGKRLEGIEALVGVGNGALKLLVLFLKSFLIVAQGVVVADLPKHAGVGTNRGDDRNRADDGQDREAVKDVRRHNKLLELAWRRRNVKRIVLARNHLLWPLRPAS